jgi:RNA polymerase sigma-70 factor, ECF subfamily
VRPHFEEKTWRAFERVWLDSRSAEETGADLGLPIDAEYVAKSRVLKRLRQEVLELAEDCPQLGPPG